jgi:hypothetical protein
MVAVPRATPHTSPPVEPTVAMEVLLLVHMPPELLVRIVDEPIPMLVPPVIVAGVGRTVATIVVRHPPME